MQNSEYMNNFVKEINLNQSLKLYLDEIGKYPTLTKEEEQELFLKIKNGDNKAKELFIKCNLKLVVSISKKYIGRGIDFLDIIQEGNLGLMKAMEMFDLDKSCKFSTYATLWIEKNICTLFANISKEVKFPVGLYKLIRKYKAIEAKLEKELYRKPAIEEIAIEMGITEKQAKKIYNYCLDSISIEKEISDECSCTIGSLIPSDINIEEDYINKDRLIQIKNLILNSNLKPENIEILMLRFGENMPLREIGKRYNIGHQSVSCKIESSIKKIKKRNNVEYLRTYI